MPIYEYECKKCGRVMEAFQKFSEPPLTKCESCSGKVQKLISHSTFHLKGTGWYVTDYANRSGGAPSSGEKAKKNTESKEKKADGKAGATKKAITGDSV